VGAVLTALGSAYAELAEEFDSSHSLAVNEPPPTPIPTISVNGDQPRDPQSHLARPDPGGRRWLAQNIKRVTTWFSTPSQDRYGDYPFSRDARHTQYPETPGEIWLNPNLSEQRANWENNSPRISTENVGDGGLASDANDADNSSFTTRQLTRQASPSSQHLAVPSLNSPPRARTASHHLAAESPSP
jgi:hypothetical protein